MAEPSMEAIGHVNGFFAHPSVAIVILTAPLNVGDVVYVKGQTTDFQQRVESMQLERQPIQQAQTGQSIGLQVSQRCRKHDVIYKLVAS